MPDGPKLSLTAPTAAIVLAFLKSNTVAVSELPALIATVNSALVDVRGPAPVALQEPAANLRRLVTAGAIVCAECGGRFRSIKRHLSAAHGLSPPAYRAKWGLKRDHPMVAPDYAAIRSQLAVSIGLGRKSAPKVARAPAKAKAPASDPKPARAKTPAKPRGVRKPKSAPTP